MGTALVIVQYVLLVNIVIAVFWVCVCGGGGLGAGLVSLIHENRPMGDCQ